MMKNILVAGSVCFIDSPLVRLLVSKYPNYHIVHMEMLIYAGNLENLKDVEDKENYTFVKYDICDLKKVSQVFEKYNIDVLGGSMQKIIKYN
jgi:dTDP-glucose 4,6-dehydratase